ncbi:hypothetical protein CDCA_CDCA16G4120 [Cyanidium caldarium]|uniref:Ubiquitin-like domain-containing protein n=1 Tax=Cyanidium caldarium TaxID=2771 RepID=A0AAV9J1A1_CYACA|nr:hypothetical protein CDCA_CDCA16G4120 [Cyanidium caldarium]
MAEVADGPVRPLLAEATGETSPTTTDTLDGSTRAEWREDVVSADDLGSDRIGSEGEVDTCTLRFLTSTSRAFKVTFPAYASVKQVKHALVGLQPTELEEHQRELGEPSVRRSRDIRLLYLGNVLGDEDTLLECGFRADEVLTVHVVVRRGKASTAGDATGAADAKAKAAAVTEARQATANGRLHPSGRGIPCCAGVQRSEHDTGERVRCVRPPRGAASRTSRQSSGHSARGSTTAPAPTSTNPCGACAVM